MSYKKAVVKIVTGKDVPDSNFLEVPTQTGTLKRF